MALKTLSIFLFITIVTISFAEAQSSLGIVYVHGTLYCTANGSPGANSSATPVFPNATLQVACSTGVVANAPGIATAMSNGRYQVLLTPLRNATVDSIVSNCHLLVLTPLSTCNPVLPSAGLVSNLRFVETLFFPILNLRFTFLAAAGFTLQS